MKKPVKYTVQDFHKEFPNDDACLDRIFQIKYGDAPFCPKCEKHTKHHRVSGRRQYAGIVRVNGLELRSKVS